jgi:exosome complex component RRP4
VCEVQGLHQDGGATLHTRSLKYGKLRNGMFVRVSGTGGGGGVVRSRRQVWTFDAANGGGKIGVILGVNGYIWISKHVESQNEGEAEASITRIEESTTSKAYSSQNDEIGPETRREIARIKGVISCLVEAGLRVDEDMVMEGYKAAVEVEVEDKQDYLGGIQGKKVVKILTGAS